VSLLTTAATAAYQYRTIDALPLYALKRRKAQKQRGFRAKSTYGHCIKDEVLIDPPYNTGHDFIYNDHFEMDRQEYDQQTGLWDEEENKNFAENNDSNPRFHSDWCSMIFPRLALARSLLSDDGVIFISIDDNEVGNLRKIADEVFGQSNFLANLIWEKKYTIANDAKYFSANHDHIMCYCKNASRFQIGKLSRTDKMNAAYKNPDKHPKGVWKATPLHAKSGSVNGFSYTFPNGITFCPPPGTYPRYSANTLKRLYEDNEIWFGKDGHSIPSRKTFLSDLGQEGVVPHTIITFQEGGHNHEAVEEVKRLFNGNLFNDPKPTKLICLLATIANLDTNAIILDFFSGSATTAHAVMQLNAEDGGNRKFIMAQLQEPCGKDSEAFKAGYKNICDIGKERIRRAGEKIKSEVEAANAQIKLDEEPKKVPDIGFRVLKLDDTNMKDVYYSADEYDQTMLKNMESNIKDGRTDLDLLFGCLLDWGLPLSLPYSSEKIDGCSVHTYNGGDLIACFDNNVPESVVREIAKRQPLRVVFRDSSFSSSPEKINVGEIFKLLSPATTVKVM
jgi:adenine-specific DNA-methyltransferase